MDDKEIIKRLWQLLDDIDTASDALKPDQDPFYKYVIAKAKKREELVCSDGNRLYYPDGKPLNEGE